MKARCPLCLKALDQTQQLARMCVTHGELETIPLKGDWRSKVKQCRRPSCQNGNSIEAGIFLRHIGCSETNVHWRNAQSRVVVPLDATITTSRVFHIQHWQFGVLAELARAVPSEPEMWFPLALFRTVNWLYLDENRENGTTVRLAGAQKAGKSVLATMAMTPLGYSGHQNEQLIATGENYVYVTPEPSMALPERQYLEALLPLSLLRDEQFEPESLNIGTPHTRANVKAAFFRSEGQAKTLLGQVKQYVAGPKGRRSLVFYDTAGEENERAFERYRESVDVGAVLLDATKLSHFGGTTAADRRAAQERLSTTPCQHRCLVVTKIDLIRDSLPAKERALVDRIGKGEPVGENEERELLRSWLQAKGSHPMDAKLAETLDGLRVFFVWTEGLASNEKGSLPRSFGLRKFAHWCLDGRL